MKKLLTRSAIALALAFTGAMVGAAPAHADEKYSCDSYQNKPDFDPDALTVCIDTAIYSPNASTYAYVNIEPKWYTSATECNITSYLLLGSSPQGTKWQSPRSAPVSCNDALALRGATGGPSEASTGTSAHWAQGVACVDLYFNHSGHSGWQWCSYGTPRLG
jgi:hypothetical protein